MAAGGEFAVAVDSHITETPIPLAPLAEQQRIVDAIDEQFSRLDDAVSSVRCAAARLPALRYSLLAAAVTEGESCTIADLVDDIEAGRSFKTEGRPANLDEWGVIKVSAMTWGRFMEGENKAVPSTAKIELRFEIQPGDLLLSRANTSDYVGATALVESTRSRLLLSDKSMRLKPADGVDARWLCAALNSVPVRRQMSLLATGTSDSMRNISQEKVKRLRLRVPSLPRQRAIASEIERQLSFVEALRRSAIDVTGRSEVLLLQQIRAEREAAGKLAPQRRRKASAGAS